MTEEREYELLTSVKEALKSLGISEDATTDVLFRISENLNK